MKKMCYTYSRQKYPFPVDEKPGKDRIMRNNKRKRKTQNKKRPTARSEDFIMKPSVDWCFKELMRNPKTRKGFIAAMDQSGGSSKKTLVNYGFKENGYTRNKG